MTVMAAWIDGLSRVARAPWLTAGLWLVTVVTTLPLALVMQEAIAAHLGSSLAADAAAAGVNYDWWNEFLAQASGLSQTFVPAILGFAAVMKNTSSIADAVAVPLPIALVILGYIVVSVFLMGGVLDRLARARTIGSHGFFFACGVFVFRFLRLAAIAALVYGLLFTWVHDVLFDDVWGRLTHDLTVERTAFIYRVLLYSLFAALLLAVNLWFDFAKVRMVVEDRRSAFGALGASLRFIQRHPGAALTLYLMNVVVFLLVLALYALVAPGASGGVAALFGFFIAQVYIALRIVVRLLFVASEIALFQGRLAHAGYTAAIAPVWPDSPAAEAIRPE